MHNNAPSIVAMCVHNPDRSPLESIAETQPQLHPALLRLSAMISQDFTHGNYAQLRFLTGNVLDWSLFLYWWGRVFTFGGGAFTCAEACDRTTGPEWSTVVYFGRCRSALRACCRAFSCSC